MLDMASRWRAERCGVALVVVFLVFSPLLCSAWSDNREFIEQQGNSSFLCKSSGPCVACTRPEKEANKFHCRTNGYHQSFKCLEIKGLEKTEENKRDVKHVSGDRTSSEDSGTSDAGKGRNLVETPAFKIEGGLKTYLTFKSCTPAELRMDKFTVLQFEAIAFASFALCSPLVYYRRKHSFSGMTRLPTTNPRF
ncbi:hypothetical protein M758_1G158500 [Ceratodon purpureus]|uniref:Uncharacterized protein n=1 Tax=Ceratodon purpureus TaxID=3225 RepID=A0A8T0J5T9_CERPU|nr:hypothetical protein KC19_1G162800 [Ceratodon purpureus]KAG0630163.1 hypothetical protein M758_1G158500 [Ceratodon purpureus]